jgi:tol-pal system protein YbgF
MRSNWPTIALLGGTLISLLPAAVVAQASLSTLEQRLQRVERLLDSSTLQGLLQRVETQQSEIRGLQGNIDVLNHKLQLLDQHVNELNAAAQAQAAVNPDNTPGAPPGSESAPTAATPADTAQPPSQADPAQQQAAYNSAFQLLREGEYAAAITAMQQLLQDYPDGRYGANAQYWIGEAHYAEQRYEPALQAFRQVIRDYPDSAKSPDAMLKIGIILAEQGNNDDAQQIFRELQQRFPGTSAARLASIRIKQ